MAEGKAEADKALQEMLLTGAYSDLVIKCGDFTANVHKAVICPRSKYFAAACKPGAFKEGQEGIINLHASTNSKEDDVGADDPTAVKLMIDFLYLHDYEAPVVFVTEDEANVGVNNENKVAQPKTSTPYSKKRLGKSAMRNATPLAQLTNKLTPSGDCNTVMHAKMYALGSKYSIESLQIVALGKYMEAVSYAWNNEDFPEAVRIVYSTTPDTDKGLRDVTALTILQHQDTLLSKPEMEHCLLSIKRLPYDLFKLKPRTKPDTDGPSCNTCGGSTAYVCNSCRHPFVTCSCDTDVVGSSGFGYTGERCRPCRANTGFNGF